MDTIKHENQLLFVGSYTHQLDTKKRIIFPSSWRNLVGINHQIFAFPHPEQPCLFLYLKDEMLRRIDKLRDLDVMESQDHKAVRSIAAGSELLQWDTQGRIRLGSHLLRAIDAKEQIVLVGVLSRIEIWSLEHFDLALPQDSSLANELFYNGY